MLAIPWGPLHRPSPLLLLTCSSSSQCPALENRYHPSGRDNALNQIHQSTIRPNDCPNESNRAQGFIPRHFTTPSRRCGLLVEPWESLIDEQINWTVPSTLLMLLGQHIKEIFQKGNCRDLLDTVVQTFVIFVGWDLIIRIFSVSILTISSIHRQQTLALHVIWASEVPVIPAIPLEANRQNPQDRRIHHRALEDLPPTITILNNTLSIIIYLLMDMIIPMAVKLQSQYWMASMKDLHSQGHPCRPRNSLTQILRTLSMPTPARYLREK